MDNRIGTLDTEGHVLTWPERTIMGGEYSRTSATRHRLDATHFVILPTGFRRWALVDELKRSLGNMPTDPQDVPTIMDVQAGEFDEPTGKKRNKS